MEHMTEGYRRVLADIVNSASRVKSTRSTGQRVVELPVGLVERLQFILVETATTGSEPSERVRHARKREF